MAVSVEIEKNQEQDPVRFRWAGSACRMCPKAMRWTSVNTETVEISVSAPVAELESLKADDVALSLNLEDIFQSRKLYGGFERDVSGQYIQSGAG